MDQKQKLLERGMNTSSPDTHIPRPELTKKEIKNKLAQISDLKERVFKDVEKHFDFYLEMFQSMIRIPSVNPSKEGEKKLAHFVLKIMKKLNMEVTQIEPEKNRVSNLATLKGENGIKTLLFNSHLDTVPIGDIEDWQYPPFDAVIADNRIWGRGSKDCKLGIASSLAALESIQRSGIKLKNNYMITTTADEETGGHLGIHQFIKQGLIKADWCIYGEGDRKTITTGARGACQLEITVKGESAHTGKKSLGRNAIKDMAVVIQAIDSLSFPDCEPHPNVPGNPVASVNMIQGGIKENIIPNKCKIVVDSRFPPNYDSQKVLATVERTLNQIRASNPYNGGIQVEAKPLLIIRPYSVNNQEPIVLYLSEAIKEVLHFKPEAKGMFASSDARWIYLDAQIPTVNYSLGNDSGHRANEYVRIQDYKDNIKIYALLALMLLM